MSKLHNHQEANDISENPAQKCSATPYGCLDPRPTSEKLKTHRNFSDTLDLQTMIDDGDAGIKRDIIHIIAQYLGDEGYNAARMVLQDETSVKLSEREEQTVIAKRIQKALLDGDWLEVDVLCRKSLKNYKSFLYKVYRLQYMEYIENQLYQKAYVHLGKRLKPLEHLQPTSDDFKNLCYLLTAKSIYEIPQFKNWQGPLASREELANDFARTLSSERLEDPEMPYIPPNRLLSLMRQAVAYQVYSCKNNIVSPVRISTLLKDYLPPVVPNNIRNYFHGHTKSVKSLCFTGNNNRLLISGSKDNTCRIWDSDTGAQLGVLTGHSSMVWDVCHNKSTTLAASASADGTVKIWDIKRKACLKTYSDSSGDIYSVAFSPDKHYLVFAGYDKIVRLYDIERDTIVKTFTGHQAAVTHVVFSHAGNFIVAGSKDTSVKFWDIMSGLCVKELPHFAQVTSAELNEDGTILLSSSKDNLNRIWDLRTTKMIMRLKGHTNISKNYVKSSFMNDGLVCGGSEDGHIYIWDTFTGKVVKKLPCCNGTVYKPLWNPTKNILAACSDDFRLITWHQA